MSVFVLSKAMKKKVSNKAACGITTRSFSTSVRNSYLSIRMVHISPRIYDSLLSQEKMSFLILSLWSCDAIFQVRGERKALHIWHCAKFPSGPVYPWTFAPSQVILLLYSLIERNQKLEFFSFLQHAYSLLFKLVYISKILFH